MRQEWMEMEEGGRRCLLEHHNLVVLAARLLDGLGEEPVLA
jgi:hypothetical protein